MFRSTHRHQRGVTLIEVLCASAILSVVAGIAAPAASDWHRRLRADNLLSALTTDIALARSSAVARGRDIVLCPSRDGATCLAGADWTSGWIVFEDGNRDHARQGDETLVSVTQSRRVDRLSFTSTSGRPYVRLLPSGFGHGTNLTVTACFGGNLHARLVMNNAGRVRVERPKAKNASARCSAAVPPA